MKKSPVITMAIGGLAVVAVALCWEPVVAWYRF